MSFLQQTALTSGLVKVRFAFIEDANRSVVRLLVAEFYRDLSAGTLSVAAQIDSTRLHIIIDIGGFNQTPHEMTRLQKTRLP